MQTAKAQISKTPKLMAHIEAFEEDLGFPLAAIPVILIAALGLAHIWVRSVEYLGQLAASLNA